MDSSLVDKKIIEIMHLQDSLDDNLPLANVERFAGQLKVLSGWETFRINPIHFADKYKFEAEEIIKFFIYGAKVGLFRFEWSLLCPLCGGREHSYQTLNQLEKETYHCTLCDVDVEVEADSHLEVSFTLSQAISGFVPQAHASFENYWAYFFSPYIVWPQALQQAFDEQPKLRFIAIPPGKRARLKLGLTPQKRYRIITLDTHSIFTATIDGQPQPGVQKVELKHTTQSFDKKLAQFSGTAAEVEISNNAPQMIGIIIGSPDSAYLQTIIKDHPPYFKPFVTGKMMLNSQIFRELFLIDNLPDDLSLKINDITLLFTDLKGSTELYDKTGDAHAYKLVQKHFKILERIVNIHRGGIVKTMGDAIMASFNTPLDGVKASYAMLQEIKTFNQTTPLAENALGLKIGLHRGAVIAVKANQTLDYFGQNVNIAARVQNLASSGEIWITDEIMQDRTIQPYLQATGYSTFTKEVTLKGVGNLVRVHRCDPPLN